MTVLNESQIEELVQISENITKEQLVDLLSKKVKNEGGKIKFSPAPYVVTDVFTVLPKHLSNVTSPIRTTVGIFIFNKVVIHAAFGSIVGYYNKTLTQDNMDGLLRGLVNMLIQKKIDTQQITKFYNRLVFMSSMAELYTPGLTTRALYAPKSIKALKEKLVNEYKDVVESGNPTEYVNKIEKPLVAEATKYLSQDHAWGLLNYDVGKYVGNNYKNNCLTNGPIRDTINNKFINSNNSFTDGIEPEFFHVYGNSAIYGSYMRNLETQFGGALTKYVFSALQYVGLDKEGSDCGTKLTREVKLTKANSKGYLYRYFLEDGKLKHMTSDIINNYIGKTVKFRSPLFCRSTKICNKCFNSLYYSLGITNAGLTSTRPTSAIMYVAMKAMHDTTVKPVNIDIMNYITVEK